MVTIPSLWLPILLSAVVVWILSAVVWMFMPHRKKEFKGLRDYFLVMPGLTPEAALEDVMARFSRFGKDDAANLLQNVGRIGGSIQQLSHERDCWIY